MLAIIGGTALPALNGWQGADRETVDTPYGEPSADVQRGAVDGQELLFLPRHGEEHTIPPHRINYRANLWALHSLGVRHVLAITAVGVVHCHGHGSTRGNEHKGHDGNQE